MFTQEINRVAEIYSRDHTPVRNDVTHHYRPLSRQIPHKILERQVFNYFKNHNISCRDPLIITEIPKIKHQIFKIKKILLDEDGVPNFKLIEARNLMSFSYICFLHTSLEDCSSYRSFLFMSSKSLKNNQHHSVGNINPELFFLVKQKKFY